MKRTALTLAHSSRARLAVRVLAAILLLSVGADHFYEYSVDRYSVLPTIGPLFLLNFISATVIGLILLAPLARVLRRFGDAALELAALSGFGIAASSLVALLVSEQTKLFGFMESNYRPAILVAIGLEAAAAIFLALLLGLTVAAKRSPSHPMQSSAPPRRPKPAEARTAEATADSGGASDGLSDAVIALDVVGLSYKEAAKALHTREATVTSRFAVNDGTSPGS
jgi:hypothetical protein